MSFFKTEQTPSQKLLPDALIDYFTSKSISLQVGKQYHLNKKATATDASSPSIQLSFTQESFGETTSPFKEIFFINLAHANNTEEYLGFSNKIFYQSTFIDSKGYDYIKGNKRTCPFGGLSDESCREYTPTIIKAIEDLVNQYDVIEMTEEPASTVCPYK